MDSFISVITPRVLVNLIVNFIDSEFPVRINCYKLCAEREHVFPRVLFMHSPVCPEKFRLQHSEMKFSPAVYNKMFRRINRLLRHERLLRADGTDERSFLRSSSSIAMCFSAFEIKRFRIHAWARSPCIEFVRVAITRGKTIREGARCNRS